MKLTLLLASCAAVALCTMGIITAQEGQLVVIKKPFAQSLADRAAARSTQILYHGGPVLVGTDNVGTVPLYAIYYGDFSSTEDSGAVSIVNDFLTGLSGTGQFRVNTTYYQQASTQTKYISGLLGFSASNIFNDPGSQGRVVTSPTILKILQHALDSATPNHLPTVDGAIYMVMTAPNIKAPGFCSSFCAYHTSSTKVISGHTIRYAFVPDPGQKCDGCDGNVANYNQHATPNGNIGGDEMTDSLMHELSESATDPDINAWYTRSSAENGDLCNFNYGTVQQDANGVYYNASWLGRNFLVQTIWENSGTGFCANTLQ